MLLSRAARLHLGALCVPSVANAEVGWGTLGRSLYVRGFLAVFSGVGGQCLVAPVFVVTFHVAGAEDAFCVVSAHQTKAPSPFVPVRFYPPENPLILVGGYGASVQRLWFAFDLRICSDVHPSDEVQSMFTIQQRRNIVPTSECELLNHALHRVVPPMPLYTQDPENTRVFVNYARTSVHVH